MKQYNIYGEIDDLNNDHPQIEGKTINKNYYGSDLNKFVAENCRTDIVVNNIDLIINYYKDNKIRIIESKHRYEKLSKGQDLLLKKMSEFVEVYVIYGNPPYDETILYSYRKNQHYQLNQNQLLKFLNNEL